MKITNVSCMQFAGVCNRNVSFNDGINVIYGKNESGKSTLVNLISRTLFQRAKLDRRSDKEFFERYFPSAKKTGAVAGDFADGTITFETEHGTYTLKKEWGADARCTLSTPDGMIRDQGKIDEILKTVLLYGEGVYSDMLFSSQSNTDVALQTILDASRKTDAKQEIAGVISRAFAESDGISLDAIEQAIEAKIDEIAGKHWDFDREAPVRKTGRWATGLGEILKSYYALEDARDALKEISRLEQEADSAAAAYAEAEAKAVAAEEEYNRFSTFASRLAVQSERKKALQRIESELEKIRKVLEQWPVIGEKLEKAKALQTEQADRKILDTWRLVELIGSELTEEDRQTAELLPPAYVEFSAVKNAQREITALENSLCSMNLNAAVQMLGGNRLKITSLRTGETVDVSDGLLALTEAVKLEIPGVMVMQMSPADVDPQSIGTKIEANKQIIREIFAKYKVVSLAQLEDYAQRIEEAQRKVHNVELRISKVLGSTTMEELAESRNQAGTAERSAEEIEGDIYVLCGGMDVATFIAKTEAVLEGYAREFGSVNDLKIRAYDLETERAKIRTSVCDEEDIPDQYRSIMDPDAHLESLREAWKEKQNRREASLNRKASAASVLGAYQEANPEACPETVEKAERAFEQIKSLLGHWCHIRQVFLAQKDNIHDNPMQDLAERFGHYLDIISGGKITSRFPDGDKLSMLVYSGNNLLDYVKLSEGTKETVSLAFRLAVLDHLFPEGGGVIVFDDPFTDMDEERTVCGCKLLQECAQRHQVIFLTCKEEYLSMLGGHCIRFRD